jgi:hypothetical protein
MCSSSWDPQVSSKSWPTDNRLVPRVAAFWRASCTEGGQTRMKLCVAYGPACKVERLIPFVRVEALWAR